MRIVLVAPQCPEPADIGLKTHLSFVLRSLAERHQVEVIGYYASEPERAAWVRLADEWGFQLRALLALRRGWGLALERARALVSREPVGVAHYRGTEAGRAVEAAVASAPDRILFFLYPTGRGTGAVPSLLLPVDCYSLYYGRLARTEPRWFGRLKAGWLARRFARWEARTYAGFTTVAPVGEMDAHALRLLAPEARVEVLPVAARPRPQAQAQARPRVLVAGAFWMPAVAADTIRFLRHWRPEEAAELVVWGRGAPPALRATAAAVGGRYVEWVEDYDAFLAEAQIYVYPQRAAAGLQTKVQQAMAAGLAVVAAPEILEALGVDSDLTAVAGETAAGMAWAAADLVRDRARREATGAAASDYIGRRFAPEAVAGKLEQLLGSGV